MYVYNIYIIMRSSCNGNGIMGYSKNPPFWQLSLDPRNSSTAMASSCCVFFSDFSGVWMCLWCIWCKDCTYLFQGSTCRKNYHVFLWSIPKGLLKTPGATKGAAVPANSLWIFVPELENVVGIRRDYYPNLWGLQSHYHLPVWFPLHHAGPPSKPWPKQQKIVVAKRRLWTKITKLLGCWVQMAGLWFHLGPKSSIYVCMYICVYI